MLKRTAIAVMHCCFAGVCVQAGELEVGFRLESKKGQKSPVVMERISCKNAYGQLRDGEAVLSVGGIAANTQKAIAKLLEKKKAGETIVVIVQCGHKAESISIKIEDKTDVQARHKRNAEAERRRWAGEGVPAIDSSPPLEVQRRQKVNLERKALERQAKELDWPAKESTERNHSWPGRVLLAGWRSDAALDCSARCDASRRRQWFSSLTARPSRVDASAYTTATP